MSDQTMDPQPAGSALAELRPQPFGSGNPGRVSDPLIEPLWAGVRALAAIDGDHVAFADEHGEPIAGHDDVRAALADAASSDHLVIDGFLTKLAARDGSGVYVAMDDLPTAGQLASRPLLGIRRTQTDERMKALEAERAARTFGPDDVVSFVATDLLWLEGEALLEVPLLERRRILESVLVESDLVRRGIFVRPPIEAWLGSWRALGFTELTFKSANSRYRPGTATTDWVSLPMPRR
jgi:ATP-dependent DNA ligase